MNEFNYKPLTTLSFTFLIVSIVLQITAIASIYFFDSFDMFRYYNPIIALSLLFTILFLLLLIDLRLFFGNFDWALNKSVYWFAHFMFYISIFHLVYSIFQYSSVISKEILFDGLLYLILFIQFCLLIVYIGAFIGIKHFFFKVRKSDLPFAQARFEFNATVEFSKFVKSFIIVFYRSYSKNKISIAKLYGYYELWSHRNGVCTVNLFEFTNIIEKLGYKLDNFQNVIINP